MILERILGQGGEVGKYGVNYLPGSEQWLVGGVLENTGEFLGLNEMRGICRPSKQPVAAAAPRSFLLPLFAFTITSFPSLRYCRGFCEGVC